MGAIAVVLVVAESSSELKRGRSRACAVRHLAISEVVEGVGFGLCVVPQSQRVPRSVRLVVSLNSISGLR